MPKLTFENKITWGNLLTLAVLLIGGVATFYTLQGSVIASAERITTVSDRVTVLETNLASLVRELNTEKVDQTRILTQLQTDMSYTRAAVDEIRRSAQ